MLDLPKQVSLPRATGGQTRDFSLLAACIAAAAFWLLTGGLSPFSYATPPDSWELKLQFQQTKAAGNLVNQVTWTILAVGALSLLALHKGRTRTLLAGGIPLWILLLICTFSIAWSPVPDIAFRRVVRLWFLVIVASGTVVSFASPHHFHRLLIALTGIIMSINLFSALVTPELARDLSGNFLGVHVHKNTAGIFAMLAVLVWFSAARFTSHGLVKTFLLLGAALWFLFLIGTNSRTSILTTVFVLSTAFLYRYAGRHSRNALTLCLSGAILLLLGTFLMYLYDLTLSDILDSLAPDTVFGRMRIWEFALDRFRQRPIFGIGYGSFWAAGGITPAEAHVRGPLTTFLVLLNQAHNGYVDVLVAIGTLGAISFVFLVVSILRLLLMTQPNAVYHNWGGVQELCYYIFLASLLHNMTETSFLRGSSIFWLFFLMSYFLLCRFRRETVLVAKEHRQPS